MKQFAKFVVDLADSVAPTDIEEGMRVGVDRNKWEDSLLKNLCHPSSRGDLASFM